MPAYSFVQCDVFTDRPLSGNALAVFTDGRGLTGERMQAIAAETNLSETTFVLPAAAGGDFAVRIFTPRSELAFAGHPLIGAAVVVGRSLPLDRLVLETGAGPIPIDLDRSGGVPSSAVMRQPQPAFEPFADAERLCTAVGVPATDVVVSDNGTRFAIVACDDVDRLSELRPDTGALAAFDAFTGTLVYADAGDVVRARMFAPAVGVPEDPGTGSAVGPLAVHLGRPITALQGVEIGRPCIIIAAPGEGGQGPSVGGDVTLVGRGSYQLP